jgi:hypothetical protein
VIDYVAGSDRLANQDAAFSRAAVLHWLCFPVSGGRRLTVESQGRCPGSADPDPGSAYGLSPIITRWYGYFVDSGRDNTIKDERRDVILNLLLKHLNITVAIYV